MTTQATASDQNAFVGIDFGTTKTMVASYDPGKKSAKPLTFGRGKFEKPTSMYATENGDLLFGDDADDEGITDLPNHIRRFKMKLGKPGMAHVGRKSGTAKQLTAEFLENLRNQLENQMLHTSVNRVVLTVPAMFGPAQRHDLTEAARQAGFSQVELLEEPVAAGIAYCDQQSDLSKQLRFIVVDWGGGTFDVAHLERLSSGDIKVHEDFVVGLDDIGGEVFDDELWGIASNAMDSAGHGTLDGQSRENWGRYRRDLSRAKESLSAQMSVSLTFALSDGKPAKVTLNRTDFNNIISPMIQKAASFVSQLLVRAHNAGCPPEFILLAGGTSRIPLIGEELERITGVKCRQWSDGREAIALGAAIRAHQLWSHKTAQNEQEWQSAGDAKIAAMAQYRSLLEVALIDGIITQEERVFLGKKRKELGLTIEESQALQIQILGTLITDVVKPEVGELIPECNFTDECGDTQSKRSQTSGKQRGSDLRYDLEITQEEATLGVQKELEIEHYATCSVCNGEGASGTNTCQACTGEGVVQRDCRFRLKIPPGVDSDTRLRCSGKGDAGSLGGSSGDLYLFLHVRASQTEHSLSNSERGHFDVVLADVGPNKIAVIKALREAISNLALAEAKTIAESTPIIIIQNASRRSAEEVRNYLKIAGASIQLIPLKSQTHTPNFSCRSERTDIPSEIRETNPGYSERKFNCPNRQCGKEMVLTPVEFIRKTYTCPYCKKSGSISSSTMQESGSFPHPEFSSSSPKDPAPESQSGLKSRASIEAAIKKLAADIQCKKLYISPNLPNNKVSNAIGSYAPHVSINDVILLYDDTLFGSAKDGLILTRESISWRNGNDGKAQTIKYKLINNISSADYKNIFTHAKILINNSWISVCYEGASTSNMVARGLLSIIKEIM